MNHFYKIRAQSKAFTIVELLVVIAIMAMMISILIPSLSRSREITQRLKCASTMHGIGMNSGIYANDYKGYYPTETYTINGVVSPTAHNTVTATHFAVNTNVTSPGGLPTFQIRESGALLLNNYLTLKDVWCPNLTAQWTYASALWSWNTYGPPNLWLSASNYYVGYDFRCEGSAYTVRYISPERDIAITKKPIVWDDVSGGLVPWGTTKPFGPDSIAQYGHLNGYNALYGDLSAKWISDPGWQVLKSYNDFSNGTYRDIFVVGFLDKQ